MFPKMELEVVGVYCEGILLTNGDEFDTIMLLGTFDSLLGEEGIPDATFSFP